MLGFLAFDIVLGIFFGPILGRVNVIVAFVLFRPSSFLGPCRGRVKFLLADGLRTDLIKFPEANI